jgi:hypothetical protein
VPDARSIGLWPLTFGQRIGWVDLAALREDSESWLWAACRRNEAFVIVAPSKDVFLNQADFPLDSPVAATVAIRLRNAIRFEFDVTNASFESQVIHLFLQSEGECIYWGAYQPVNGNDHSYVFLTSVRLNDVRPEEPLEWEALGPFVDLPLDTPDSALIAYFTDDRDAATVEHRRWQNNLAAWLRADGLQPRDYRSNQYRVDIAWELEHGQRFACEVKTTTTDNERSQIFGGMGQAQTYGLNFDAQPILFLGAKPTSFERVEAPARLGVLVLWPEVLDVLRPRDLDGADSLGLLNQLL